MSALMEIHEVRRQLAEVTKQRDELLRLLRQTRQWVINDADLVETHNAQLAILDHGIAKIEGEPHDAR